MIQSKDIGEILAFPIGGGVLSLMFGIISPLIAGLVVAGIMILVKGLFTGTPISKKGKEE